MPDWPRGSGPINGIGRVKALQLAAIAEIGRWMMKTPATPNLLCNRADAIAAMFWLMVAGLQVEKFWVLNRLIKMVEITSGTATAAVCAAWADIIKRAVQPGAVLNPMSALTGEFPCASTETVNSGSGRHRDDRRMSSEKPAVDRECDTGDEGRRGRGQEADRFGDFARLTEARQTRQMVERDIGFLARDASRWIGMSGGSLGQQLSVRSRAEADARIAPGRSSQLEEFILSNPGVHEKVRALKHSDLVRWAMLALMRETNARKCGSAVIAAWREKLGPELKKRVDALQSRYSAGHKSDTPEAPNMTVKSPAAKRGA